MKYRINRINRWGLEFGRLEAWFCDNLVLGFGVLGYWVVIGVVDWLEGRKEEEKCRFSLVRFPVRAHHDLLPTNTPYSILIPTYLRYPNHRSIDTSYWTYKDTSIHVPVRFKICVTLPALSRVCAHVDLPLLSTYHSMRGLEFGVAPTVASGKVSVPRLIDIFKHDLSSGYWLVPSYRII